MLVAPPALTSWDTWDRLDTTTRLAAIDVVLGQLGAAYATGGLVGERGLGAIRHVATDYELVLLPGGRFTMGLGPDDERRILDVLEGLEAYADVGADDRPGARAMLAREVAGIAAAARPVREVEVAPFLCGRRHLGELALAPTWRWLCEAEWEYVARASYPDGWLLHPPLAWNNDGAPERAFVQESPLGLFDLISWDGEGFADEAWPVGGGYVGAPATAIPHAPPDGERDAIARGGPSYEWASEIAGVWAFFAGARSNAYGKGRRAAISLSPM